MSARYKWRPLQRAVIPDAPPTESNIQNCMEITGQSREQIVAALEAERRCDYWKNDLYQVAVRKLEGD